MKKLSNTNIATAISIIVFTFSTPSIAAKIDVSASLKNTFNSSNNIRYYLIKNHGFPNDFAVNSIKLNNGAMKKVDQHIPVPSGKYELVAATQYLNCGGLPATREISLNKTTENSSEVSIDNSFNAEVSVSAGVSAGEGPVSVEGSVSVSAGYNFNEGTTQSNSSSVEISDSQSVDFPDERGVWVFGLYTKVVRTEKLPFWIDFELEDDSELEFSYYKPVKTQFKSFYAASDGYVEFYEGSDYNIQGFILRPGQGADLGNKNLDSDNRRSLQKGINSFAVKNPKGIDAVCVYTANNFQNAYCSKGSISYIAGWWKNLKGVHIRGVKVVPKITYKTIKFKWGEIKRYFSESQSRFRVHGVLGIENHGLDSKRFISSRLSPSRVKQICREEDAIGDAQVSDL